MAWPGEYPYEMIVAAEYLEALAHNNVQRFAFAADWPVLSPATRRLGFLGHTNLLTVLLSCLRLFPLSAPSVGHGFRMHGRLGHNLDAVSGLNFGCVQTPICLLVKFLKSLVHLFFFCKNSLICEEENTIRLQAENIKRPVMDKYRCKRKRYHEFATAARLWVKGLPWGQALQIVKDAFDAVVSDDT